MGCAAVVRDAQGHWISGVAIRYGCGNPFLAEILAIEKGLLHAWSLGYRKITCASDCINAVMVFQTDVDVTNFWARNTILRIRALLSRNWSVLMLHVPREKNNTTDCLAREASKAGFQDQIWRLPPSFTYASLYLDSIG